MIISLFFSVFQTWNAVKAIAIIHRAEVCSGIVKMYKNIQILKFLL